MAGRIKVPEWNDKVVTVRDMFMHIKPKNIGYNSVNMRVKNHMKKEDLTVLPISVEDFKTKFCYTTRKSVARGYERRINCVTETIFNHMIFKPTSVSTDLGLGSRV